MNERENDSVRDSDTIDRILQSALKGEAPPDLTEGMENRFELLRKSIEERTLGKRGIRMGFGRFPRFLWAGVGALVVASLFLLAALFPSRSNLSWAEMVRRVGSVKQFSTTVYYTDNFLKPTKKMEMWVDSGIRKRIHSNGNVFFVEKGKPIRVFDVREEREFDPESLSYWDQSDMGLSWPLGAARELFGENTFSLEALLAMMPEAQISSIVRNEELGLEDDVVVFDVTNPSADEATWFRVWAAADTGLPIRALFRGPDDNCSMDMLFDYAPFSSDDVFSAEKFKEAAFSKMEGADNKIYALIKDPSGRSITRADLLAEIGYHMPTVKEIGMMEDGVVWVIAGDADQKRPNGREVVGFGRLTDDLGQEYVRVIRGKQKKPVWDSNVVYETYMPIDWASDRLQKPNSLILTCVVESEKPDRPDYEVGTLTISEWKNNQAPPFYEGNENLPWHYLLKEFVQRRDWDRFDSLTKNYVPDYENEFWFSYFSGVMRVRRLMILKEFDQAFLLAEDLWTKHKDNYQATLNGTDYSLTEDYLKLLAYKNRKDRFHQILLEAKEYFDESIPNAPDRNVKKDWIEHVDKATSDIAQFLTEELGWDIYETNFALGIDVRDDRIAKYKEISK